MKTARVLIGALVCMTPAARAQQQAPAPSLATNGTAMAVAPSQNGQSAVWITTGGFVYSACISLPLIPIKLRQGGLLVAVDTSHAPRHSDFRYAGTGMTAL
jgi:hypothetical protein